MIIVVLVVLGLCLGSFINALVWRLHEQSMVDRKKKSDQQHAARLSISKGHSMCPRCKHELAAKDLLPVLSWLSLQGKCRYCNRPISVQYPLVELLTAALFVASYLWWPEPLHGLQVAIFVLWLPLLTGLIALVVYDVRWLLLPDRILYPLGAVAAVQAVIVIAAAQRPVTGLFNTILAVIVGGGIFYGLFQVSNGKWIGGGDVKLGWLLGLVAATPARSLLFIFLAAIGGSLVSLPLLANGRLKRTSTIPFGPFLIIGLIVVQLFGKSILHWYMHVALPASG
jgi:leader peptidase (prepilin peptidase)/N-methyltransferase